MSLGQSSGTGAQMAQPGSVWISASQFDAYPVPQVDELLDWLGKTKYIMTLDLAKGYWQIPLRADSLLCHPFRAVLFYNHALWIA